MRHTALFLAVALAGAGLDLLTKHLAFKHVPGTAPYAGEVPIVDGFFTFGETLNKGVIFGMGQNAQWVWYAISILAIPAILAIYFSVRKPKWILTISLGMILAGTIGNMVDRVFTEAHAVRDFLKFFYRDANGLEHVWPLFNLADSFICVGVFLLTVEMLFFDEKKKKAEKQEPAAPSLAPALPAGASEGRPAPGPAVEGK